jgi:hypothetical protein
LSNCIEGRHGRGRGIDRPRRIEGWTDERKGGVEVRQPLHVHVEARRVKGVVLGKGKDR